MRAVRSFCAYAPAAIIGLLVCARFKSTSRLLTRVCFTPLRQDTPAARVLWDAMKTVNPSGSAEDGPLNSECWRAVGSPQPEANPMRDTIEHLLAVVDENRGRRIDRLFNILEKAIVAQSQRATVVRDCTLKDTDTLKRALASLKTALAWEQRNLKGSECTATMEDIVKLLGELESWNHPALAGPHLFTGPSHPFTGGVDFDEDVFREGQRTRTWARQGNEPLSRKRPYFEGKAASPTCAHVRFT